MIALPPLTQRLLRLMDHSLDFVELLGANGVVKGVSAAIKPLSGYDPQDLVGRQYQDFIHPEDRARAAKAFAHALRGKPAETVTLRYLRKDGSWRKVLASTHSFLGDPAVGAVVVLTRDVTEQSDAESSLLRANVRVGKLAAQLTVAGEKERRYVAAELHDDVQQILVGLRMCMTPSRRTPSNQLPSELVQNWIDLVQTAIDHLHELTVALRTPVIDDRGLPKALRSYVDRLPLAPGQKLMLETDANVGALAPDIELACFRVVQEGLANAVKHSGAEHLNVTLKNAGDHVTVSIGDDGVGFDVNGARAHAANAGSVGLSSMSERVTLAGGNFEIHSSVGHGTKISASFPTDAATTQS